MQDPRIRLFSTVALSVAAYISIWGAMLAILWWLAFTPRKIAFTLKQAAIILLIPAIVAILTSLSGGDGPSYMIRISSILLIASWAYTERYPGELLDLFVWLFGKKIGFDIGMVAEMSVSALEVIGDDIQHVRIALAQKGEKISVKILVPVISFMLLRQMQLAQERACILAIRGYTGGGNHYPCFIPSSGGIITGAFSGLILLFSAFIGDFFMVFSHTFTV